MNLPARGKASTVTEEKFLFELTDGSLLCNEK